MSVTSRKVETPVYDGTTGAQTDTHVTYELGDTIDGVFVPFASVRGSFVEHQKNLAELAKEQAKAEKAEKADAGTKGN